VLFEVVALDAQDGSIELQHFDGTLEEAAPEDWLMMGAEKAGAPEDWSGSVDINTEDLPGSRKPQIRDWQSEFERVVDANSLNIDFEFD
jgi:hypothetical protein